MGCSFVSGIQSALGKAANNPVVNTIMQFTPAAPIWDAANAVYQASQGNIAGAITSAIGAYNAPVGGYSLPSIDTSSLTSAINSAPAAQVTGTDLQGIVNSYGGDLATVAKATGIPESTIASAIDPANLNSGQLYQINAGGSVPFGTGVTNSLQTAYNNLTGGASVGGSGGTGTGGTGTGTGTGTAGLPGGSATGLTLQGALNYMGTQKAAAAAEKAAQLRADAATQAGQQSLAIFNQQTANQAPWLAAGTTALGQLSQGTQPGGDLVKPFSTADMTNVMPAYTFAKDQGLQAMENQLRAQGQTGSNVVQGAGTLASGLASQYEGQAFNQYQATQNAEANKLQSLANLGQTATQTQNSNLGNLGTAQSQATLGAANATAGGISDVAGLNQSGLTQLGNTLMSLLSKPVGA